MSTVIRIVSLCCVLGATACTNMSRQEQSALSGATVGGVAGLAVGALVGAPVIGAMIGGAGGAAVGAMRQN